jgi:hypothetical protein
MEAKGRLVDARTFGKPRITLELDYLDPNELDELRERDLRVDVKRWREKRSLDANALAWVLMQKIAEKIHSDKWTVYLEMLQRYSRAFTHIIVKPQAVSAVMEMYRTAIDLGEILVDGETGHQLQVYFGSHTFNTKEMSVFIDGLMSECRELGIPTISDKEAERMVNEWDRR